MREIKFRAWDSEFEEFIYSDVTYDASWFEFKDGTLLSFAIHGMTHGSIHEPPEPNCVELETVQQYTGLKDRNGKEIYEGDILKSGKCFWLVDFARPCFKMFRLNAPKDAIRTEMFIHEMVEIIGNIYESPALLTEIGAERQ